MATVDELFQLAPDRGHYLGVIMAKVANRYSGSKIEILLAVFRNHIGAVGFNHSDLGSSPRGWR
jgi:hypothetical protein